ncbi:uncharacterized protein RHTO_02010 [Rhodotorula toruloides NP11]|uniref:Uncharacterized protein n=1 Tax=Rhodotorula toruloides (strain NP11) TaxID=1130832 RepID=M7XBJ8_RHOT1|nr:uncharacterized protein RHTO_02010 [Rhodotorula toruloides NP11]EMS21139.1 hypothetical protein RHTO_02010 [Rhodotorula toruloides NP11]
MLRIVSDFSSSAFVLQWSDCPGRCRANSAPFAGWSWKEEAGDGGRGAGDEGNLKTPYVAGLLVAVADVASAMECPPPANCARRGEGGKQETRRSRKRLDAQPTSPRAPRRFAVRQRKAFVVSASLAPRLEFCEGHTLVVPSLAPAHPLLAPLPLFPFTLRMLRRLERLAQHMASTQGRLAQADQGEGNREVRPGRLGCELRRRQVVRDGLAAVRLGSAGEGRRRHAALEQRVYSRSAFVKEKRGWRVDELAQRSAQRPSRPVCLFAHVTSSCQTACELRHKASPVRRSHAHPVAEMLPSLVLLPHTHSLPAPAYTRRKPWHRRSHTHPQTPPRRRSHTLTPHSSTFPRRAGSQTLANSRSARA